MTPCIVLDLPIPPSVNALFQNVSAKHRAHAKAKGYNLPGRVKTPKYRAWLIEAGWAVKLARQQPISGPVEVVYTLPDEGEFDLGNIEKATTDLLVRHGLIQGDERKIVRGIAIKWSARATACRVVVKSVSAEPDTFISIGEAAKSVVSRLAQKQARGDG